jgi:hypothetical protein
MWMNACAARALAICGIGARVSDSVLVAWMTAQAVLADRNPGPALASRETAVRAECFENGLPADLRGKKASELDHFGRARHPKAAGPIVEWIVSDRGCLL